MRAPRSPTTSRPPNTSMPNLIAYIPAYFHEAILFRLLSRAIPEAGYITLGTIRYGIKLANGTTLARRSSASMGSSNHTLSSDTTIPKRRPTSGPHTTLNETNGDSNQRGRGKCMQNTPEHYESHITMDCDEAMSMSDVSNSSNACNKCNRYCCIDATRIPLPWCSSNKVNGTPKVGNADPG